MKTILLFCLSLFCGSAMAQWAELVLPSSYVPGDPLRYPLNETGMIFAIKTSNKIYGFDQNSKVWSEYTANTTQDWDRGFGGGNVSLLLNDSVAVAYSSVLSQFSELRFAGKFLNPLEGWPTCAGNSGVIMTTERIYVYDALTNSWSSHEIDDYSLISFCVNYVFEDFLIIAIDYSNGSGKYIAYSPITKTFAEYSMEGSRLIKWLDHGFCITCMKGRIAGYSAFTGVFNEIYDPDPDMILLYTGPLTGQGKVSENALFLFYKFIPVGNGDVNWTNYIYNTKTGQFYSNEYTFNGNLRLGSFVGGNFVVTYSYHYYTDKKINLDIFRASDNTFYSLDLPLYYVYDPGPFSVGKDIFWAWDDKNLFAVNAITGQAGQVSFDDSFITMPVQRVNMAADDWGVWAYNPDNSDTDKIYSFSGGDVSNIAYKEVNGYYDVGQVYYDKMGFISFSTNVEKKWSVFSPVHNSWYDFESTSAYSDYSFVPGNFVAVNYSSKDKLELYDAVTNEVRTYPRLSQYHRKNKNGIFMYNNAGQYVGYSAVRHSDTLFQTNKYYGLTGVDDISVITPTGSLLNTFNGIIYDSYRNILAGLKIPDSLGTIINGFQSGRFCFYATQTGHVYAYTGEKETSLNIKEIDISKTDGSSLLHNYPNPFQQSTTISYKVPAACRVIIKIFDQLGREVATPVNEKKAPGTYELVFNASGLSGGIYFAKMYLKNQMIVKKIIKY